jgi:uncharacterized membrane protein
MIYLLWCATTVCLLIVTQRVLTENETNIKETQSASRLRFKLETSLIMMMMMIIIIIGIIIIIIIIIIIVIVIKHKECKRITTPKA